MNLYIFLLALSAISLKVNGASVIKPSPPASNHPDIGLNLTQLIDRYGYPSEVHEIITEDGYILQAIRIPYGRLSGPAPNKKVVWLMHGLLGSATDWVMNTVEKSFAYMLADAGYDVWMGNNRGNRFSRRHISLTPKKRKFWHFSIHEMAEHDVPAMINYALRVTRQEKLFWVGCSQGSAIFFASMAMKPQYNSKIRAMFGLGPAAYVHNMVSPIKLLAPIANNLEMLLSLLGPGEFLPGSAFMTQILAHTMCKETSPIQELCSNMIFLVAGFNSEQMNMTQLPLIMHHVPAGSSSRAIIHYAQLINSKKFRAFNHGWRNNLKAYGQRRPPVYDLSKVRAPVSLHYGKNDWLVTPTDVALLASELPNLIRKKEVDGRFNHLDFIYAIDADKLVYNDVLDTMKYY